MFGNGDRTVCGLDGIDKAYSSYSKKGVPTEGDLVIFGMLGFTWFHVQRASELESEVGT